jgi:hypothetical protein
MVRPLLVDPPRELGCDVELRSLVELEPEVELVSARRIVPVEPPLSLPPERMLEHPVMAIPSAATSAIQIGCFMSPPLASGFSQGEFAIAIPSEHRDR